MDLPTYCNPRTLAFLGAAYGDMAIDVYGDNVRVTWSPGDATAYEVIVAPVSRDPIDRVLVAETRITRAAVAIPLGSLVHATFLAGKLPRHEVPLEWLTIPAAIINATVGEPSYAVRSVAE